MKRVKPIKAWAVTRLGKILIHGFEYTKTEAMRTVKIMGKRYSIIEVEIIPISKKRKVK